MHKTLSIIEANEASTSTPPAKKKTIDPTLEMNILPSEIYLQGLNALPNNHARNGITTDLSKLPVFDGTQVIVTLMNQVFDFCTARMLNHQSLLSLVQGLQIFTEGMKVRIRIWMTKLNTSQFVLEEDDADDKGLPPAVTRMLIHIIRRLCKEYYIKPKQSALQMLNLLTAQDFSSTDTRNKPSFLHFDNVIPFVVSVLETGEAWNRTDEVVISTVENIIR